MKNIIEVKNISKSYGKNLVLDDISFTCTKGEAIAFKGANGCGKSTLLRILSQVTTPTSGKVILGDSDLKVTFIPDHYEKINIKVKVFLSQVTEIYQSIDNQKRLDELIEMFRLETMLNTPLKYLSKGSLQKVAIIQALLCESDLLYMDEPLSGQDMLSKMYFVDQINEMKEKGTSIIMACHDKDLINEIADRVFYLEMGKIVSNNELLADTTSVIGTFFLNINSEEEYAILANQDFISSSIRIGSKCKVTTMASDSSKLFTHCTKKGIHILKYEEGESS
jgi:ABC-type multidrug transport system ATPase subunit